MSELTTYMEKLADLPLVMQEAMFSLYSKYYDGTSQALFLEDLAHKDYALLLKNPSGALQGFTTLKIISFLHKEQPLRAVFSGDTIIHHQYWGQQALAFEWIRFAGGLKSQQPDVPLYWLLIVKGYRTYRYLSAFCRTYSPHWRDEIFPGGKAVLDHLADRLFGDAYHPESGLVRYPRSRGHLKQQWAGIPENMKDRPEVRFFLERNPGFDRGHELVCLTELAAENLKPLARRIFMKGAAC